MIRLSLIQFKKSNEGVVHMEYKTIDTRPVNRTYMRRKQARRRRRKRILTALILIFLFISFLFVAKGKVMTTFMRLSPDTYPESLLDLMERNPETSQFVRDYPKNKDKPKNMDISGEVTQGTLPLFIQWDERWGYETYGSDFLAITGCGPTCLSMVKCGLSGDTQWNPYAVAEMAESQGYYVDGVGTAWSLMESGAQSLGLQVHNVSLDAASIKDTLSAGMPIICTMRPGDFTTSGHFIVLSGVDADGKITVLDPNSIKNSEKSWDIDTLIPQIKNLWAYT